MGTRIARNPLLRPLMSLAAAVLMTTGAAWAVPTTELIEERAASAFQGVFPAMGRYEIRLGEDSTQQAEFVKDFWIDPDSGRFIANVVDSDGMLRRVWGVAVLQVPVPVPTRRIYPEEIVSEADITLVEMPLARLGAFTLQDVEQVEGMQVKRMLHPGRPVSRMSVEPPMVIEKGSRVTIELSYGGLTLNASGRSLEDAHLGEVIRVVNLSSNKTLSAVAQAAGIVKVEQ